jgi:hypothetical protein
VKRAVSRDGLGRHTAATVCLDSQADKLFDAATVGRLTSDADNALGVPKRAKPKLSLSVRDKTSLEMAQNVDFARG